MDQEVAKTLGDLELKLQELERELTTIGHRDAPAEPPRVSGKLVDEAVEHAAGHERERAIGAGSLDEEQAVADGDGFGGPPVFGGEEVPAQAGATIERDWTVEARETAYGEIPTPPSQPPSPLTGPPLPPPEQAPPSTFPGPPIPATPPEQTPSSTLPGVHPPSTSPGVHPYSTSPGAHPSSTPPGIHPPSTPAGSDFPSPYRPDPRHPAAAEESQAIDLAALVRFRDKLTSTMDELIDEYSRLLPVEPPSQSRRGA